MKRLISSGGAVNRMEEEPGALVTSAPTAAALTLVERHTLADLERRIEKGMKTFIDVGQALIDIRDRRLYREDFSSFEDYVEKRWEMSVRHAHRMCDAAEIVQNLLPGSGNTGSDQLVTSAPLPQTESQARPLKGLDPEAQQEIWKEAVKSAPGGQVTAAHVEETRERLYPTPAKPWASDDGRVVMVSMPRVDGGDIDKSNCHDLLAGSRGKEPPEIKRVFEFEGDLWVVSLGHHGGHPSAPEITQEAHRLIPDNSLYSGPKDGQFFADGRTVIWQGSRMRLGPTVIFKGELEAKDEERDLEEEAEKPVRTVRIDMERAANGGDISIANSAGKIAEGKSPYKINPPFEFEGKLFCVTGSCYGRYASGQITHDAHELIPAKDYTGPKPRQDRVVWKGEEFRLGPLVLFKAEEFVEVHSGLSSAVEAVENLIAACDEATDLLARFSSEKPKEALRLLNKFRSEFHRGLVKKPKPPKKTAAQLTAERWTKAAAKQAKDSPAVSADPFVICRSEQSGRPTFRTERGGWTTDPDKAQAYPNATAAKFVCHSYDVPMKLSKAKRKVQFKL